MQPVGYLNKILHNSSNMSQLLTLARQILLAVEPSSLSKVKFAKMIYFTHKGLILKDLMRADDIRYVKMPLGPVPEGYNMLTFEGSISKILEQTGLTYDQQLYSLSMRANRELIKSEKTYDEARSLAIFLKEIPTSTLVESSHKDLSWITRANGDIYEIGDDDLNNPLPKRGTNTSIEQDKQKLQAQLLDGMLDDIVISSTQLEYPTED